MYFDGVILFSIIVVLLTAGVVTYALKFMFSHMREDIRKHPEELVEHKHS
ncbi:hypothetical protein [Halioxenophilus aromaticivorans]|uniref:Uncharacterized protein n=1 Tax=Halioxenophilus aromaticivorans TaxID=1306992 RepID=A0AAV3U5U8_9ALTE